MKHPPGWFWPDGKPWQVFREEHAAGRAVRDVVQRDVTRAVAEHTARELNLRQRPAFMRRPWYAAPMEDRA